MFTLSASERVFLRRVIRPGSVGVCSGRVYSTSLLQQARPCRRRLVQYVVGRKLHSFLLRTRHTAYERVGTDHSPGRRSQAQASSAQTPPSSVRLGSAPVSGACRGGQVALSRL